jgi:acetyl esterase
MTKSLPGQIAPALPPAARRKASARDKALAVSTRLVLMLLPKLPVSAQRLLAGGSITIDGNTLDPALQLMLAAQRAAGITGLVIDEDPVATREYVRETSAMLREPVIDVGVRNLAIPGPACSIPARHYRPAVDEAAPLLVYYHGGGFVFGDPDTYDAVCRLICRDATVHVLSIDYRLAPENKAPAAVDDAFAAYRWAQEHVAELGADPVRVAVGGDSAGGCLAAVVSQLARNAGGPVPALQWLIYPVTNPYGETRSRTLFADRFLLTKGNMDWFHGQYLNGSGVEPTDPRVAPLLADDLSGLPPALVITAGFDPLRDEGEQYAAALHAAGVAVDLRRMGSLTHGFINFNALGGGSSLGMARATSALRAHLRHS